MNENSSYGNSNTSYSTNVATLIQQVTSHPNYYPQISEEESSTIFKSLSCFNFIIRNGESERHYFISYISKEHRLVHQSIRIEASGRGYYINGGGVSPDVKVFYLNFEHLICTVMECQPTDLQIHHLQSQMIEGL